MAERVCPGLPADWLNGWLAAIGAVVLDRGLRLRWSDDPVPLAVLVAPGDDDPAERLASRWPDGEWVQGLPLNRHLEGHAELSLNPTVDAWRDRAALARPSPDGWALSSLYTDLTWDPKAKQHSVERGQLHTPMPGRDNTVFDRLRKLLPVVSCDDVTATLDGRGARVSNYGLGFDVTRIASLADDTEQLVDPIVEILAFFGMALFPVRGDGRSRWQRCWSATGEMWWCAWRPPLSCAGIDAFLDLVDQERSVSIPWVLGVWRTVPYQARGSSDVTRGYGAERVERGG